MTAPAISNPTINNPICVALDSSDRDRVVQLAHAVASHVGVFKIGLTAWAAAGPSLVAELAPARPVFVDLKLHDIPAQVGGAVGAIAATGARYTTVHASGGRDMLRAAADAGAAAATMTVLAVTVLTSLDERDLHEVGFREGALDAVLRLTEMALDAGLPGVVCSPREVGALRERFGAPERGGPVLVVPGIRASGGTGDDQRRTLSAREAVAAGADILVIGRPITAAPDPAQAAAALLQEVS